MITTNFRSPEGPLLSAESYGIIPNRTLRKIAGFSNLKDGWHFGKGAAPSSYVTAIANSIASFAMYCGLSKTDAFPGTNGEITVALYIGNDDHSFQIQNDLSISYWIETDPNSDVRDGLSMSEVLTFIRLLVTNSPWNSLSTFTSAIGTRQRVMCEAKPSKIQAMEVAYHVFPEIVLFPSQDAFARTPIALPHSQLGASIILAI